MSWLFKTDASSPASFEKALSKLSNQIATANVSLDTTRARSRRANALWTLYTTLLYLLYTLVIALVLGPQKWSLPHYAGLLGAPVVIYLVRRGLTLLFDWQIRRQQTYLTALQKQRDAKITDLKKATKYDSTQELLQKYGGAPKPAPKAPQQGTKRNTNPQPQPGRTGIAPPPTANIPSRAVNESPSTPRGPLPPSNPASASRQQSPLVSAGALAPSPIMMSPDEPGFAPNAFSNPQPASHIWYEQPPHWYDRIFDVLLGEDETLAKNRLALICQNCRLVNGQAPPGVKTLEEVGRWRCGSCNAGNGVENVAAKVAKEIAEEKASGDGWEKTSVDASTAQAEANLAEPEEHEAEDVKAADEPDSGHENSDRGGDKDEDSSPEEQEQEQRVRKRTTRSSGKQQ